jgi:hypothetical protein
MKFKLSLAVCALALSGLTHAQAAPTINQMFDQIDLSPILPKVMAMAITIVSLALLVHGPDVAKRIIDQIDDIRDAWSLREIHDDIREKLQSGEIEVADLDDLPEIAWQED